MAFHLFGKRLYIAEGTSVTVSPHFSYTTFGVRGRHDKPVMAGTFVQSPTPGTGFFARPSDSRSYNNFVKTQQQNNRASFLNLVRRREPSYDREIHRAIARLKTVKDQRVRAYIDTYLNCLRIGKEADLQERVIRRIKDNIKRHRSNKNQSLLTRYKSSLAGLQHDLRAAQHKPTEELSHERLLMWEQVVESFMELMQCRRIWHVETSMKGGTSYHQVFFDLGIFDFIYTPSDTPIIRTHDGTTLYLYPDCLISAKSSLDFTIIPLNELNVTFQPVDLSSLGSAPQLSSQTRRNRKNFESSLSLYGTTHGQIIGSINFEQLNMLYFTNRVEPAQKFVAILNTFISTNN